MVRHVSIQRSTSWQHNQVTWEHVLPDSSGCVLLYMPSIVFHVTHVKALTPHFSMPELQAPMCTNYKGLLVAPLASATASVALLTLYSTATQCTWLKWLNWAVCTVHGVENWDSHVKSAVSDLNFNEAIDGIWSHMTTVTKGSCCEGAQLSVQNNMPRYGSDHHTLQ